MNKPSRYITRTQAARLAGITTDAISYRTRCGELTTWKDPGDRRRTLYDRHEVEQLAQRLNTTHH